MLHPPALSSTAKWQNGLSSIEMTRAIVDTPHLGNTLIPSRKSSKADTLFDDQVTKWSNPPPLIPKKDVKGSEL